MTNLQKIFWVALAVTILAWVGVGIYYLSTRTSSSSLQEIPSFRKTPTSTPQENFQFPGVPEISNIPSDTKTVEGLITKTEPGKFILESEGQTFTFFLDQDSRFIFPGESEGVVTGEGMKVYYREESDRLYVIKGIGGTRVK